MSSHEPLADLQSLLANTLGLGLGASSARPQRIAACSSSRGSRIDRSDPHCRRRRSDVLGRRRTYRSGGGQSIHCRLGERRGTATIIIVIIVIVPGRPGLYMDVVHGLIMQDNPSLCSAHGSCSLCLLGSVRDAQPRRASQSGGGVGAGKGAERKWLRLRPLRKLRDSVRFGASLEDFTSCAYDCESSGWDGGRASC